MLEALRRRFQAGVPAFTVLCCDNMPDNGQRTRQAVMGLAVKGSELALWIGQHVAFPGCMVDRIVPAMDAQAFSDLQQLGCQDPAAVVCESFSQWVIEDHFPQGRPDWELDGVQMVADVRPFETMKLRIMLKKLLVRKIDYDGKDVVISFHPRTPASPETIIAMMRNEPKRYRFTPDYRLTCGVKGTAFEDIIDTARTALLRLLPAETPQRK